MLAHSRTENRFPAGKPEIDKTHMKFMKTSMHRDARPYRSVLLHGYRAPSAYTQPILCEIFTCRQKLPCACAVVS